MGFPENTLEGERRVRGPIELSNYENEEQKLLGKGGHNAVRRSIHGYVLKEPNESPDFLKERESLLDPVDRVPWSEVIVVEEGGDEDESPDLRGLVRMAEADLTHEETVQSYGFQNIIQEDFQMFVELAEQGIIYEDFKPANIGYFSPGNEPRPDFEEVEGLPIDLYDHESMNTEELRLIDFQAIADVYMTGNSEHSGLTGNYDLGPDEAHERVISALAEEPEEIIESDFYGIDDVTREFYRNNLR